MAHKRTHFIMTPQLVWATCENTHQFMLWSVIKMVAGEEGTCILGTRELAAMAMIGVATAHRARQDLLRLGLLEGQLCRDPGYPYAVWHLRVPDLWAANHAWREAHPSLRGRIENKRAQYQGAPADPQSGPQPEWPPRANRSEGEQLRSERERTCSEEERARSEGEPGCSAGERKDIHIDPIKKQERSLDTPWQSALPEFEMQFSRQVYDTWIRPLWPGGWYEGPEGARAVLFCPSSYIQEWCRDRLGPAIQRVVGGILGRPGLEIEYRVEDEGRPTSVWETDDG
jgi:hypothetical protein